MTPDEGQKQLFAATTGDSVYVHLRDSEFCGDVRAYLGKLWTDLEGSGLVDPDFLAKFASECPQRIWELRLITLFRARGLVLVPSPKPGAGMDFGVRLNDGRTIWVEATAPSAGAESSRDRVSAPYGQVLHGAELDRATALRFLSAFKEKREQFARAKSSGLVDAEDGLIIAVSGARIDMADRETPGELPLIVKTLFGIGDTPFIVPLGGGDVRLGQPELRPVFKKSGGAEVEARLFTSPDASEVSAVIFDPHHVKNCAEVRGAELGHDLLLVHNPHARVGLAQRQLRVGREYVVQIGVVDHRASPPGKG